MLEGYLRPWYQKYLVNKVASFFAVFCSANSLTLFGLLFGITVPVALCMGHVYLAVFLLLLSGYFDTLDGTVARIQGNSTIKGTVIDIISDRIVEVSVILGLFLLAPDKRGLVCMLMLASSLLCITSFLVTGIFSQNSSEKGFYYSPGLMERAEAFIFFIVMMLFPRLFFILAILYSVLVVFTSISRTHAFIASLE